MKRVLIAAVFCALLVGCQGADDPELTSMVAPAGTILIAPPGEKLIVAEDLYRRREVRTYRLGAESVIIARQLFERTIRAMIERRGLDEDESDEPQRYDITHREKETP